jgi:hypothetical protein
MVYRHCATFPSRSATCRRVSARSNSAAISAKVKLLVVGACIILKIKDKSGCIRDLDEPLPGQGRDELADLILRDRLNMVEIEGTFIGHAIPGTQSDFTRNPANRGCYWSNGNLIEIFDNRIAVQDEDWASFVGWFVCVPPIISPFSFISPSLLVVPDVELTLCDWTP